MQKLIGIAICMIGALIIADDEINKNTKEIKKDLTDNSGTDIVHASSIPTPATPETKTESEEIKNEPVS